jgi:hypothetical protein
LRIKTLNTLHMKTCNRSLRKLEIKKFLAKVSLNNLLVNLDFGLWNLKHVVNLSHRIPKFWLPIFNSLMFECTLHIDNHLTLDSWFFSSFNFLILIFKYFQIENKTTEAQASNYKETWKGKTSDVWVRKLRNQNLVEICLSLESQTCSVIMHKKKPLNDDFQNVKFESNSLQTFSLTLTISSQIPFSLFQIAISHVVFPQVSKLPPPQP